MNELNYNVDEYITSRYISGKNIKDFLGKSLIISSVTEEKFEKQDEVQLRLALHFNETDKILTLNSSSLMTLKEAFGKFTEGWINKKIQLVLVKNRFNNDSILVVPLSGAT